MTYPEVPPRLTVECDGSEYEVSRQSRDGFSPVDADARPVWVIRSHANYIGTFPVPDGECETLVRETARSVIRNGSTSFHRASNP